MPLSQSSQELYQYLPPGWEIVPKASALVILTRSSRDDVDEKMEELFGKVLASACRLGCPIEFYFNEVEQRPYRVIPEFQSLSINKKNGSSNSPSSLILEVKEVAAAASFGSEVDADLARLALREKERATWIIDQETQEVLLANRAALEANEKPPRELLMTDISSLWENDSLMTLTNLVSKDKTVLEHTNTGYRWKKEGSFWTRKKHEFFVDYQEIEFLGRPARFELVKEAVPC